MEPYMEKAWDCLTEQEQNSLFLNLSNGLSARETGEILKVSHYKYLEIKARAEKLFKLFSDFFKIHPSLVNPSSPIDLRFADYLFGCMVKRLPKEEAKLHTGDSSFLLTKISNIKIEKWMSVLKQSEDEWDKDLYALIMEFDRWNSYRILPRKLQAPTPYKRRTNKKEKVYIKYLHRIPDFKIRAMVDKYWSNGKPENRYYISIISTLFDGGYSIIPIRKDKDILSEITKMKIYIFSTIMDADIFGVLVKEFFERTKDPKSGLKFWEEYRSVIKTAINYREINNMDFTCSNLDMAYNLKRKSISKLRESRKNQ